MYLKCMFLYAYVLLYNVGIVNLRCRLWKWIVDQTCQQQQRLIRAKVDRVKSHSIAWKKLSEKYVISFFPPLQYAILYNQEIINGCWTTPCFSTYKKSFRYKVYVLEKHKENEKTNSQCVSITLSVNRRLTVRSRKTSYNRYIDMIGKKNNNKEKAHRCLITIA